MDSWRPSVCPFDCPDTCGLLVRVKEGRATAVKGDPEHPFTQGFICQKMAQYPARVHHPQRITKPLLRVGPKGEGRFKEIGWDQALALAAAKLEETAAKHGPAAILPYSYAGHMGHLHRNAGHAFFHRLGASKLGRTICSSTASAGFAYSLGTGPGTDLSHSRLSDLIIVWGCNVLTTNLHAWPWFQEARRGGARLVVIDPYANQTALKADTHLKLRPGSDAALALGLMQVLINEELLDHEFIAAHTLGFADLQARAAEYPPERAAELTGVSAAEIVELGRAYGRARAPYIRTGCGPARQLAGGMAMRTIALLPALVGAFERPGGGILRSVGAGACLDLSRLTAEELSPAGTPTVNMVQLGAALAPEAPRPLHLLWVYLSNPAVVAPDSSAVLKGLAREDLFLVCQEMFMTETARWADLILPGAGSLEITELYTSYGHRYVQMAKPVIAPVGQCRSLWSVFQEMAGRMGFDEEVFTADEEQHISWMLDSGSPCLEGITLQSLSAGRPLLANIPANPYERGFLTPSGKVEFYCEALAAQGLDPLPDGAPSREDDHGGVYPLQLITPPRKQFLNSTFNELEAQRERAGEAEIYLHPDDAAARGIVDGGLVRVFNGRGECLLRAKVSEAVLPGVTVAEGLYWGAHTPGGTGINHLTSQALADLGGSSAFHCNQVEVAPAP
ncbi:molybdopterin-containing oxidoreductase family protein [Desulfoferula mesophila]|uniref:Formate dehydrogenase n=1 Tax=Desulfoferula mesophila TaxID=3058419 RepID=A0AAU9EEB4_9BACT|nr:formate dehydrogenase [Desulfoferula mesophilus]